MNKTLATFAMGTMIAMAIPAAADAKTGVVKATGTCSKTSASKIKLTPQNGKIETEFEVDQNKIGQRWTVVINDNGVVVANTAATTVAPSGSFTIRRLLTNRSGTDTITARATNAATGESCTARASI